MRVMRVRGQGGGGGGRGAAAGGSTQGQGTRLTGHLHPQEARAIRLHPQSWGWLPLGPVPAAARPWHLAMWLLLVAAAPPVLPLAGCWWLERKGLPG